MEAPHPPDTVEPNAVSCRRSRSGPVFRAGVGVFQPALSGKYPCYKAVSHSDGSSGSSTTLGYPDTREVTCITNLHGQRSSEVNELNPERTQRSTMGAPYPPDTVEPNAVSCRRSRSGPVFRAGEGGFQPAHSGKYPYSKPSSYSDGSSGFSTVLRRNDTFVIQPRDLPAIIPCTYHHDGPLSPDVWNSERTLRATWNAKEASDNPGSSGKKASLPNGLCSKSNGIWLYYQNVRGLRTKIDAVFLTVRDCNFDVVIMTETGLDDRIDSLQLFGTSYNVFRCDRNSSNSNKSSFGGVLIAVSQRHISSSVDTAYGPSLEQICVSTVINGQKLLLCAIYIPPDISRDVRVMESHLASVRELCDRGSDDDMVLVCGDYNQPQMHWIVHDNEIQVENAAQLPPASSALIEGMDFLNLNQANMQINHLGRTLDLVFASMELKIDVGKSVAPLVPVDAHHPALVVSIQSSSFTSLPEPHLVNNNVRSLNYRKIDFPALLNFLNHIDWQTVLNNANVDEMTQIFCSEIQQWLSSNVPSNRIPVSPVWSTALLRDLRRKRNACRRKLRHRRTPAASDDFRKASEVYRKLNAVLYKSYVQRVQVGLRSHPKGFWSFVNSKRKNAKIPSNVYLDATTSSTTGTACELFASHFASVFASCSASDQEADHAAANVPRDIVDLNTFMVSPDMVIAAAKKLKSSFSPGPDGIPSVIYSRCSVALAQPLSYIFNKSFDQAKFPEIWKQSFMFPVFKNGDRRNVKQYRGITNLSAGSKLFELVVSRFILSRTVHYISADQHGFMPGRSVTSNLLEFTTTCINHMEKKAQVDVIYTDLKAAFDRIDHVVLLRKLSRLGASEKLTNWLCSYLTNRTLRVKLDTSVSAPFTNRSGVPQGSNLGPLLFTLFFNDVAALLGPGCKLIFADDLKLYLIVRSIEDCRRLQALLDQFVEWCRNNQLIISIAKCSVMTFHRKSEPIIFNYSIEGIVLQRVTEICDLGLQLDHKLTFTSHMTRIIAKANRQLGFISKISRDFNDPYCLKSLYCALVRPILEFASPVWSPHHLIWCLKIERVQKRFIRNALRNLPWRDPQNLPPYADRCQLLNLETLERRRRIQQATTVAKILNGEMDAPELLSRLDFRATRRTRNTSLLQHRFHRTSFGFNEPMSSMIRMFSQVEEAFEFGDPSSRFTNRLRRMRLL